MSADRTNKINRIHKFCWTPSVKDSVRIRKEAALVATNRPDILFSNQGNNSFLLIFISPVPSCSSLNASDRCLAKSHFTRRINAIQCVYRTNPLLHFPPEYNNGFEQQLQHQWLFSAPSHLVPINHYCPSQPFP